MAWQWCKDICSQTRLWRTPSILTGLMSSSRVSSRFVHRKSPHGNLFLAPLILATAAFVCMMCSSCTCKFLRIKEDGADQLFSAGIWKVEAVFHGGIQDDAGWYIANSNECVHDEKATKAARVFTVLATFVGAATWGMVVRGAFLKLGLLYRILTCVTAFITLILNCLFFTSFGHDLCDDTGVKCSFAAGAYLAVT